ncbi:hypothetical protein Pan258_44840 [Symmachiella dynata]|nr:YfjI family protein [Symmachiella dynata]QDT50425.1 hypothetical protein Pan258_44840 [Symmachiella dynata]
MGYQNKHSQHCSPRDVSETSVNADGNGGFADTDRNSNSNSHQLKHVPDFQPFPVDVLPEVIREYVVCVARSIGCDPSFVVLPAITVCAGVIGNTRRLRVKRSWFVPPILWTVLVGDSGTQKSPPLRAVFKPLKERQQDQIQQHCAKMATFKDDQANFKRELKSFEKSGEGARPTEPERPVCERCLVSDTTIEGLVPILQENPRGVVLHRDELVGWFGGFDRYSKAGQASADAAHWLSIYNAESLIVDRKTGEPRMLSVPNAAVSVCGGIQPSILTRALGEEHRENGLAARLLMTYPPRRAKRWTDDDVPMEQEQAFADVVERLAGLQPDLDRHGDESPGLVFLTDDARSAFINYYNATGDEQSGMTGDLAAAWSKLEEVAARLALVFHCIRGVMTDDVDPRECDAESMAAGIAVAEWFKAETERIQTLLSESEREGELRSLAEWIRLHGGTARPSDLVSNRRDTETVSHAELKLQSLVSAGLGQWRNVPPGPRGGRPTREFVLLSNLPSVKPI